jgi:hypothetical protein
MANKLQRLSREKTGERQVAQSPADRFRKNLRHLIRATGSTQKTIAGEIGLPYGRLRKLCSNGLAKIPRKDPVDIQKIVHYFGLKRTRDLWNGSLIISATPKTKEDELDQLVQQFIWAWRTNRKMHEIKMAAKWIRFSVQVLTAERRKKKKKKEKEAEDALFRENERYKPSDRRRGRTGVRF